MFIPFMTKNSSEAPLSVDSPEALNINISINNPSVSFILDDLGIAANEVFDFSPYKRLTQTYSGTKLSIKRTSDNATDTITTSDYSLNGDINSAEIVTWSQGGDVLVTTLHSEKQGSNAYQVIDANKPKIVESGVFLSDGLKFDGSNDFMVVDKYSAVNIINPPLSYYHNSSPSGQGYIFMINTDSYASAQYGFFYYMNEKRMILNGSAAATIYQTIANPLKVICSWSGTGLNETKLNVNETEVSGTNNITLNEASFFNIGVRSNNLTNTTGAGFFTGSIKTIIVFNTNEYANYSNLVAAGI